MGRTRLAGLSIDCGLSHQPLLPQSPQKEGKESSPNYFTILVNSCQIMKIGYFQVTVALHVK